jgi:2-oxoglutarate ferredoxin oxidoreductase subunit alpha
MSDLDLGMNPWMSESFEYPPTEMDRGKVLSAEDLARLGTFGRYRDVDGDGIPYRTLPGTDHPLAAWFARGTGHDADAAYSERPDDWDNNLRRIWRKLETARGMMPRPVIRRMDGAKVGLIGFGSASPAIEEARDLLTDGGLLTSYMRLKSVPFPDEVASFIRDCDHVYVIEMNVDGQMRQLLQLEVPDRATDIRSLTCNTGLPLSAEWVQEAVRAAEEA